MFERTEKKRIPEGHNTGNREKNGQTSLDERRE